MVAAKLLSISLPWRLVADPFKPAWKQRSSIFGLNRNLEGAAESKVGGKGVSRNIFLLYLTLSKFAVSYGIF